MKLYVYCLVEAVDEKTESLHGIAGLPVRLLKGDGLSLLVSDFAGETVAVNRENVRAHAAVIQTVFKQTTPLPVRFGTLVTEAHLESYLTTKRAALEQKLALVRGCVEMNVKIISDQHWAEAPVVALGEDKPGTAFLIEKRREILGGEARAQEAKRIAEWFDSALRDVVRDLRAHPPNNLLTNSPSKLIVAAAHLLERERVDEFRGRIAGARVQQPDLRFLVSGPWAPYSFANVDLEFKSQFGVS